MAVIQFVTDSVKSRRLGSKFLFTSYSLHATLAHQSSLLSAEIDAFPTDYLISVDPEAVYLYLESKYIITCPKANFDRAEFSEAPTKVDVSHDWRRGGS